MSKLIYEPIEQEAMKIWDLICKDVEEFKATQVAALAQREKEAAEAAEAAAVAIALERERERENHQQLEMEIHRKTQKNSRSSSASGLDENVSKSRRLSSQSSPASPDGCLSEAAVNDHDATDDLSSASEQKRKAHEYAVMKGWIKEKPGKASSSSSGRKKLLAIQAPVNDAATQKEKARVSLSLIHISEPTRPY